MIPKDQLNWALSRSQNAYPGANRIIYKNLQYGHGPDSVKIQFIPLVLKAF